MAYTRSQSVSESIELNASSTFSTRSVFSSGRRGADTLSTRIAREETAEKLLQSDSTFYFEGWLTAPEEKKLGETLSKYCCAWETEEPDPEHPEEVPIQLRNNALTRPYNIVTEMYSLPAYNGLDPNPFIMPFFALFFGIMFGDLGQGLCLALIGLVLARWKGMWLGGIITCCGLSGAVFGCVVGLLKSYCNVNEVISGIMLNWIGLYTTNMILTNVKEDTSPYTLQMKSFGKQAILPSLGFDKLLGDNKYITMAIPLSVLLAIVVWIVMEKTMFGYELKATGFNKNAAKYCGMQEKRNTILTLVIAGALAGLGGSLLYQTGYEQWQCTASSVPAMGFNGIAATFLGGLNPIGTIFASFFIQHITAGGAYVDKSIYCSQVSDLISSLIIYLCAFVLFLKTAMNRWIFLHEERKAKKAAKTEKGGEA